MSSLFFQHPLALVESEGIGRDTRVWAWAHIMKGARVGSDCNIGEHCFVEEGVVIGDRVTVKNGVSLWRGLTVDDDVFIGPNAVFTNDLRPRSRRPEFRLSRTVLKKGCSIGANATVVAGIEIGSHAMVGAGAVVTRAVPAHALVIGNPARLHGYVCVCGDNLTFADDRAACSCGRSFERSGNEIEEVPHSS